MLRCGVRSLYVSARSSFASSRLVGAGAALCVACFDGAPVEYPVCANGPIAPLSDADRADADALAVHATGAWKIPWQVNRYPERLGELVDVTVGSPWTATVGADVVQPYTDCRFTERLGLNGVWHRATADLMEHETTRSVEVWSERGRPDAPRIDLSWSEQPGPPGLVAALEADGVQVAAIGFSLGPEGAFVTATVEGGVEEVLARCDGRCAPLAPGRW